MLLQLLGLLIVFFVALIHYSVGKSLLVTVIIGVLAFVVYFLLTLFAMFIVLAPVGLINKAREGSSKDDQGKLLLKSLKRSNKGKNEYFIPLYTIITVVLLTIIFNLLHITDFIRALFYLTLGLYSLLSYLDKVFTHLPRKFIPQAIEIAIYAFLFFGLLNASK